MTNDRAAQPIPVLEIGGTHVTSALVAGGVLTRMTRRHLDARGSAEAILGEVAAAARELGDISETWGVAIPGPFDYDAGVGSFTGVGKFESLNGYDVRTGLATRLGVEPHRLRFVNDATSYGLGEWAHGAGRGSDRMVCLTLGTGVGSVFLSAGRPVEQGDEVPPQGHVHHIRHEGSALEDVMSRRGLRADYARRTGSDLDVHEIVERLRGGDDPAATTWDRALSFLGRAVGPHVRRFDADTVVVGGSMARSFDLAEGPLRQGLRDSGVADDVRVVRAEHLDEAPLLGTAEFVRRGG